MPSDTILPPGLVPRFLSRAQAAAYLGVSPETFMAEVMAGTWPGGRPRGGKGGKLTWDRVLLDRAADAHGGLQQVNQPGQEPEDDAVAAVERRIDGQTQGQRHQHRHQA